MKKIKLKRFQKKQAVTSRITNETVAEHREYILAGGRKFKYPIQYSRHRVVINTIIITVSTVLLLLLVGWWQLYVAQNTTTFFYRVTKVTPVPVASVNGRLVAYSDYLMYLNSSVHYLKQNEQTNIDSEDGRRQIDYIKRKSIDNVIANAYAEQLASEYKITITDKDVEAIINQDKITNSGVMSQETYEASALNLLGWTPEENKDVIRDRLIRNAVSYEIDDLAKSNVDKVTELLQNKDADFDQVAKTVSGKDNSNVTSGVSGLVPNFNNDGGLSVVASKLQFGQVSSVIKSTTGDGYYVVKLLDKTDSKLSYAFIKIPLTSFSNRLIELRKNNKINEYISIPLINNQDLSQPKE